MFAIKLGNLHSTSLCAEPRLWRLGFLLYHRLLWLFLKESRLPSLCMLNPDSTVASKACSKFSLCSSYPSCWPPEV